MRLIRVILLALLISQPAIAEPESSNRDFEHIKPCTPGTVDGTQVFENYWKGGDCNGTDKRKKFVRVTDFVCEATCSVVGRECVHVTQMNRAQKAHYDSLRKYTKVTLPSVRTCTQGDGETIRVDAATNATQFPCNPGNHATRMIDAPMGKCFILFGDGKPIGSVNIPNATALIKREGK